MCAAPFCEPNRSDYGVASFGQRGFGGIIEDANNRGEFLPQYNLEAFWRRNVGPFFRPIPLPLIYPRCRKLDFTRIPGEISWVEGRLAVDNRNLLCASINGEEPNLRIWTVSERSKRNFVERWDVKVADGIPNVDSLSPFMVQRRERPGWKFKQPILQLKTAKNLRGREGVWVRSERSLDLLVEHEQKCIVKVFKDSVRVFEESPHLAGEMVVVDIPGMLWIKDFNEETMTSMRRIKSKEYSDEFINSVAYTDHARIIATASNYYVRTIDVREDPRVKSVMLFDVPKFENKANSDTQLTRKPKLRHLFSIPTKPHHFMTVSTHAFYLLDDRFPKTPMLTLSHSVDHEGHLWLPTVPLKDPIAEGEISTIFCLDQFITQLTATKIYFHKSQVVSSVNMLRNVPKPKDYGKKTRIGFERYQCLQQPCRAVTVVNDLLLTQYDDGSVWWNRLGMQEEQSMQELDQIEKYIDLYEESPPFVEQLPAELKNDPRKEVERLEIKVEGEMEHELRLEADEALMKAWRGRQWDEVVIQRTEPVDEDHKIPQFMTDVWEKVIRDY